MIANNINTVDQQSLSSQVHCDLAITASCIEDPGYRQKLQGIEKMLFQSPHCTIEWDGHFVPG